MPDQTWQKENSHLSLATHFPGNDSARAVTKSGFTKAYLPGVAEKAVKASSILANPLPLAEEELIAVVKPRGSDRQRPVPNLFYI